jgi:hypothetical protein
MVDLAYLLPVTRAETRAAREKAEVVLQSLGRLNFTRRWPAPVPVPSADVMRGTITGLIRPFVSDGVDGLVLQAAIDEVQRSEVFPFIERALRQHPEFVQIILWAFAQRDYANRVTGATIESFLTAIPGALQSRHTQLVASRGASWVNAHLALAALTPATIPTQLMFACGLVYQLGDDTLSLIADLIHIQNQPGRVRLEAVGALKQLLELAFASDEEGMARARQLGRGLAHGFSGSIQNALFPDPFARLGTAFWHPESRQMIRAAASAIPGGLLAQKVASLLLVPFELGAFLGPVLLDLLLAILGLVIPGFEEMLMARAGRYLRRVIAIADEVIDAERLARDLQRLTPDLPDARGLGRGARFADDAPRGVPDAGAVRVREVERGTRDAPHAPPDSAPSPEPPAAPRERAPGRIVRAFEEIPLELRQRLWNEHRIDVLDDDYTLEYMNRIFARQRGTNLVSGTDALIMHARADSGELAEMIRHGLRGRRGGSELERIQFLRPVRGETTPDLRQIWGGSRAGERYHIEVRTVTQAPPNAPVGFAKRVRPRQPFEWSRSYLKQKIVHEQIDALRQGSVVFRAPFREVADDLVALQDHIIAISRVSRSMREGRVRRIEFTGFGRRILVFDGPSWRGMIDRR